MGNNAIFIVVPAIEEISKTLGAFFLGANILFTHMVFGAIEALYDGINSSKKIAMAASMASIATHTALGIISYYAFELTGNIGIAIVVSTLLHFTYNYFIVKS